MRSHQCIPWLMPKWIFLLAPFCWEHLTSHEKFPNQWKPKLQLVDQRGAGGFFPFRGGLGRLFSLTMPRLGWFSSSNRDPPPVPSPSQARPFPIASHVVLNPLAPTNFGGTAPWLLEGCLCVPGVVPDVRGR